MDWMESTSTSAMNPNVVEQNSTEEATENIGPHEDSGYEQTVVDTENRKKMQRITKEDIGHPMDFRYFSKLILIQIFNFLGTKSMLVGILCTASSCRVKANSWTWVFAKCSGKQGLHLATKPVENLRILTIRHLYPNKCKIFCKFSLAIKKLSQIWRGEQNRCHHARRRWKKLWTVQPFLHLNISLIPILKHTSKNFFHHYKYIAFLKIYFLDIIFALFLSSGYLKLLGLSLLQAGWVHCVPTLWTLSSLLEKRPIWVRF